MEKIAHFIVENGGGLQKKLGEDNENTSKREALEELQRFLTGLAKLIRFDHITTKARTAAARGGRVTFTEPPAREGKQVVGIELDQRVREFMAECAKNGKVISYTESYPIVRKQVAEEKEGGIYA